MEDMVMNSNYCKFCNVPLTQKLVDLGMAPLANSFLSSDMLASEEPKYPLRVFVCSNCLLIQTEEYETSEKIFSDYLYFSSYSQTWLRHAEDYVNMMITRFGFDKKSQIIEIASNDGYLLQYFKKKKIPILGVEPAANVAKVAEKKGIPTIIKFFGIDTAKELVLKGTWADLLIGNNVLAHVPRLNDFVAGMKIILKQNGIITMEFPHLLQLIQDNQFDTIYHEHFFYFSLHTVQKIFSYHGLSIFDVDELPTHGGSLRIYATHTENNELPVSNNINKLIQKEKEYGLTTLSTYTNFQNKVDTIRENIRQFFINAKNAGKKIVCYGAAAKGNTLLNYCGIGSDLVEYVVDLSPYKQGLYLPGVHIPVYDPKKIHETKPDYVLILPWNLKDEIMQQLSYIRSWGGRFVVPIPEVKIY